MPETFLARFPVSVNHLLPLKGLSRYLEYMNKVVRFSVRFNFCAASVGGFAFIK